MSVGISRASLELIGGTPAEFTAQLKKQIELIARSAKAANIRPAEH